MYVGFCGKINKESLCDECEEKVNKELNVNITKVNEKYYEKHISLFEYEGDIRSKILSYKFQDNAYMYKTFAKIIIKNEKLCSILKTYDIIMSVPIHRKRKNERGYNQSELVAKEIARNLKMDYQNLLIKAKNNSAQSLLNVSERIENVKNVYKMANKKIITNKKIVVFDDIYTTGNTVNECSKILKQNGADEILILTLAR